MAHKCQDKRRKLLTKEKFPRQKKNARGKKEVGNGKREISAAKENIISVKRKKRRQKKVAHCTATGNSHGTFYSNNAEDDTNKILCVGEPHAYRLKTKKKQELIKNHCDRKLE